eukprot:TRINITY_DN28595_c0_g1_i1.p1 TRINITY_DN28595_c0_g1~~TRINITY_DN28595_c0_g1_i1.p1  ORF type:complete len:140 (-),score=23.63 TRINITY_DN28595_c0_g1_i1:13-432(-)
MSVQLSHLVEEANSTGSVKVEMAVDPRQNVKSVLCDATLQRHIERAAEQHAPGSWVSMPSGAAHDAQVIARVMPVAMLFVPSIAGISHNFEENTADQDICLGCRVFLDSVAAVANSGNARANARIISIERWCHNGAAPA